MTRHRPGVRSAALAAMISGCSWPAAAQTLGLNTTPDVPWWRVALALLLCIGLAYVAAILLRSRRSGGAVSANLAGLALKSPFLHGPIADRRVKLVETVRLSHQIDVCLLECDGTPFILAATPQGAILVKPPSAGERPEPKQ